jgi:hypothetical protein
MSHGGIPLDQPELNKIIYIAWENFREDPKTGRVCRDAYNITRIDIAPLNPIDYAKLSDKAKA